MTQELQARDKMAVAPEAEQTRPHPVFVPAVDIYESEDSLTLLADMPGVTKDGLNIDLKDNTLTIRGEVQAATDEGKTVLYREYQEGDYFRQFTLSNVIDQSKITPLSSTAS